MILTSYPLSHFKSEAIRADLSQNRNFANNQVVSVIDYDNHRAPALRVMQRKAAQTLGRLECSYQDWAILFQVS